MDITVFLICLIVITLINFYQKHIFYIVSIIVGGIRGFCGVTDPCMNCDHVHNNKCPLKRYWRCKEKEWSEFKEREKFRE